MRNNKSWIATKCLRIFRNDFSLSFRVKRRNPAYENISKYCALTGFFGQSPQNDRLFKQPCKNRKSEIKNGVTG